jgi:hypothetical protein
MAGEDDTIIGLENNGQSQGDGQGDDDCDELKDELVVEFFALDGQPPVRWAGSDTSPIPPRQWLLGTFFCRGFLSGLTGPGAAGKTAVRLLQLIALALGRGDLVGAKCFERTRVLIVCLEDDENELRRRIRAACMHHGIDEAELYDWLAYWTPRDLHLIELDRWGKIEGPGELGEALRRIIEGLGIGLVSVDPFVKSHAADENDNQIIDKAAGYFLQVGHDCGCAVDYLHHHRKGVPLPGDADSGRGASALTNASRLVFTLTKMSAAEAEELGITARDRLLYVRMDDAKLNIAPPAAETIWFKIVGVPIGNGAGSWPLGDNVQTVERWHPPDPFDDFPKTQIAQVFERLRKGPKTGELYSSNPQAKANWAGKVICEVTGKSDGAAKYILAIWEEKKVLTKVNSAAGRTSKDYQLNESFAHEFLGPLYRPPGAPMPEAPRPEAAFRKSETPDERRRREAKESRCTNSELIALRLLKKALQDKGVYPQEPDPDIPSDALCVVHEVWRDLVSASALGGDKQESQRKAFTRAVDGLTAKEIIGHWRGLVWLS